MSRPVKSRQTWQGVLFEWSPAAPSPHRESVTNSCVGVTTTVSARPWLALTNNSKTKAKTKVALINSLAIACKRMLAMARVYGLVGRSSSETTEGPQPIARVRLEQLPVLMPWHNGKSVHVRNETKVFSSRAALATLRG